MSNIIKKISFLIILTVSALINASLYSVLYYEKVNPYVTSIMIFNNVGIKRKWVKLSQISPVMVKAVMAGEDQRFYLHKGFDFKEIQAAMLHNRQSNFKRGASTISQQTAKNVFLYPKRSMFRKILEAYFTVLIEFYWGKDRILEVYLNTAQTGRGMYGVETSSEYYYKKDTNNLTLYQAASIAASLPNPVIYSPDKYTVFLNEKRRKIMNNLRN